MAVESCWGRRGALLWKESGGAVTRMLGGGLLGAQKEAMVGEEVAGSGVDGHGGKFLVDARRHSDQHGIKEAAKRAWEVVV